MTSHAHRSAITRTRPCNPMCRGAARGGTDPAGVRQKRGRRLRRCGVLVIRISVYGHRGCRGRWPADSGGRWHMSFVLAMPEVLGSAATDLAALGSVLGAADAAAAATTTGIVAAAQDEVSAAIAALFSAHGRAYQVASAQAAAVHAQFVEALSAGAGAYASAEAAGAAVLANPAQSVQQDLLAAVNAQSVALTGRPLIGNGANGAPGTGANGAPGGWLLG
ncbi:hypothetical protein TMMG_03452, partial [Mycobacterium tuberculosis CDC1551A]